MKKLLLSVIMSVAFIASTGTALAQDNKGTCCKAQKECTQQKEEKCTKDKKCGEKKKECTKEQSKKSCCKETAKK